MLDEGQKSSVEIEKIDADPYDPTLADVQKIIERYKKKDAEAEL